MNCIGKYLVDSVAFFSVQFFFSTSFFSDRRTDPTLCCCFFSLECMQHLSARANSFVCFICSVQIELWVYFRWCLAIIIISNTKMYTQTRDLFVFKVISAHIWQNKRTISPSHDSLLFQFICVYVCLCTLSLAPQVFEVPLTLMNYE